MAVPSVSANSAASTDLDLVRRIREAGGAGFDELVDRHADDLYGLAMSQTGSDADARDLVQETFLAAYRQILKFEGRSSLRTWLVRILFNLAAKRRRSQRVRRATALDAPAGAAAEADPAMQHRSPAAGVEARIDVMAMLDTLTDEHRQVIVLRELEQMSYQEIAGALGVPVGTVESRLHRARQDLRKRFGDYFR